MIRMMATALGFDVDDQQPRSIDENITRGFIQCVVRVA